MKLYHIILITSIFLILNSCKNNNKNAIYKVSRTWHFDGELTQNNKVYKVPTILEIPGGIFLLQSMLKWRTDIINSSGDTISWSEQTTGYLENSNEVWLHPNRADIFKKLTQLAPFPCIKKPIKIGNKWDGSITMTTNWGEWNGKKTSYNAEITGSGICEIIVNNNIVEDTCYAIKGFGVLENDTSYAAYLFSTKFGFIEMNYKNNSGEVLNLKLKNLIEK